MPSPQEQITQLEAAIVAQEALRPTLGDAAVDVVLAMLRDKIQSLRMQSQPASPAPDDLLTRFMPAQLADKMRATGRIEGERKQVTVLFADLSGYTPLSERLDAEMVMQLSQDLLKELAEAVYQYEGYVGDFLGDAVMAIFGAPVTHEDDAERALRAALAMRTRIESLNRRWIDRLGQPLELHIGVNTGTVVTGTVGSDLRMTYAVQGDTVNTAQRVQSAARRGQILVGRDTFRLARDAFTFIALDPLTVKGKREPVPVFELQRAKLLPEKSRGLRDLGSSFVGREHELAQLRAVIGELEAGRGRIVSINGEAGIGKSRLLAEWRKEIGERAPWIEGRAFPHTTALAYGSFLDLLRRHIGITDDDSEAEARARLDAASESVFPHQLEARAILANMLAMHLSPDESALLANIADEALRHRLFALVAEWFERLARARPAVLIFEDIHWADLTSLDLIESLLPLARRLPIALVGVGRLRPDEPSGKLRLVIEAQYADLFTDVLLTPLSESSSLTMVEHVLSTSVIPEALKFIILRKAEGNPFFVEEVIRSLIERGALTYAGGAGWQTTPLIDTITVPDTVQGVLMARLDALPEETKSVVQEASVIGRIFLYRVLVQIGETSIDADLDRLEREELIRERTRLPEIEYIFKHALTQEVAYESLLSPRRRELHRKVGKALETIFAERLSEFQSILGEHFLRAEAWDKAIDYLIQAGDAAARHYALAEARLSYARALEVLSHLPDTDDNRHRRMDTIIKQVRVSFHADSPETNLARLSEAESLARAFLALDETTPNRLSLARIQYLMGRSHNYRNETRAAIGYFRQVLAVAQEVGDEELLALPSAVIGRVLLQQGQFSKAEPLLAQAAAALEKVSALDQWTVTDAFLGATLAARGQYTAGLAETERSLARAVELNYLTGIIQGHGTLEAIYTMGGDAWRALEQGRVVIEMAEQSGDQLSIYLGLAFRGLAESRLGNHDAALKSIGQSKALTQSAGGRVFFADWLAAIHAEIVLNAGRVAEALSLAEEAVSVAKTTEAIYGEGWAHRVWGQALAALDPPEWDAAEAHLAESLRLFGEGDARLDAARTHIAWGDVCRECGNFNAAHEHYSDALAQFEASELATEASHIRELLQALPERDSLR